MEWGWGRQLVCAEILFCRVAVARLLHFTSQDEHLIARNGLDFAPCRLKKGTVLKSGPDWELIESWRKPRFSKVSAWFQWKPSERNIHEYCNSVSKRYPKSNAWAIQPDVFRDCIFCVPHPPWPRLEGPRDHGPCPAQWQGVCHDGYTPAAQSIDGPPGPPVDFVAQICDDYQQLTRMIAGFWYHNQIASTVFNNHQRETKDQQRRTTNCLHE